MKTNRRPPDFSPYFWLPFDRTQSAPPISDLVFTSRVCKEYKVQTTLFSPHSKKQLLSPYASRDGVYLLPPRAGAVELPPRRHWRAVAQLGVGEPVLERVRVNALPGRVLKFKIHNSPLNM